jgi:hypothetical protein
MISRDLCEVRFESFPSWPCPVCGGRGILRVSDRPVQRASAAQVAFAIDEGHPEQWDDSGVFCVALTCTNDGCGQGVAVLGDYANYAFDGPYMVPARGIQIDIRCRYVVHAIHPAVRLINFPKTTPQIIVSALERSFALYWSDPQACAATVRVAIERISDLLGSRRLDRRGKPVLLGTHLKDLKSKHPDLVEAAELIKDLGNEGAHGKSVERYNLLAAYELLEIGLMRLFEDASARRIELLDQLKNRPWQTRD